MFSFYPLYLVLLGSGFVLFCANAEQNKVKEIVESMEGDLAIIRDNCLKENSLTIDDLKLYEDPEQAPENQACFIRCVYKQSEIIGPDGEMDVDALAILPGVDKSKLGAVKKCMEKFGKIVTCGDVKKAANCVHLATAN